MFFDFRVEALEIALRLFVTRIDFHGLLPGFDRIIGTIEFVIRVPEVGVGRAVVLAPADRFVVHLDCFLERAVL